MIRNISAIAAGSSFIGALVCALALPIMPAAAQDSSSGATDISSQHDPRVSAARRGQGQSAVAARPVADLPVDLLAVSAVPAHVDRRPIRMQTSRRASRARAVPLLLPGFVDPGPLLAFAALWDGRRSVLLGLVFAVRPQAGEDQAGAADVRTSFADATTFGAADLCCR